MSYQLKIMGKHQSLPMQKCELKCCYIIWQFKENEQCTSANKTHTQKSSILSPFTINRTANRFQRWNRL